jgi:hypothetical protein
MTPWNNGQVNWMAVNGQTNVAQIHTASQNGKGNIYWWRNLLPGETLYDACKDFYSGTLSLPSLGTIVASFIVVEWTPNGNEVVQQRGFAASTEELDLFTQG